MHSEMNSVQKTTQSREL